MSWGGGEEGGVCREPGGGGGRSRREGEDGLSSSSGPLKWAWHFGVRGQKMMEIIFFMRYFAKLEDQKLIKPMAKDRVRFQVQALQLWGQGTKDDSSKAGHPPA